MAVTSILTLPDVSNAASTSEGSIYFIGNATVLLQVAGFTILTDPTFIHKHEQTWLGGGLHTTRLTDPAMELADLPPLDLVLLSHFHGDHFDQVAIRELDKLLPIVSNSHAVDELSIRGFTNTKKDNNNNDVELQITAMPGRHGPFPVAMFLPKVMGSILDFKIKGYRNDSNSKNKSHNSNQLFR